MNKYIKISDKDISYNSKCFVIAEVGSNHNRDKGMAKKLIHMAYECGADAVKFQTFNGKDIVSKKIPSDVYGKMDYFTDKKYWYQVLDGLMLPYEWYRELIDYIHGFGLSVIATPESIDALEFLETQSIDAYKVASMDVTYLQLLKAISKKGKPVIFSTGMATMDEIKEARSCFSQSSIGILHCVSKYPLLPEDADLTFLNELKTTFPEDIIGFSDHCPDNLSSLVAVSLGAKILEKHITLDKTMKGPDHYFALDPKGLRFLIQSVRSVESMLIKRKVKGLVPDREKASSYRRSIHASRDIKVDEAITTDNIKIVRNETGLKPKMLDKIVGMRVVKDIAAEDPVNFCDLEKDG